MSALATVNDTVRAPVRLRAVTSQAPVQRILAVSFRSAEGGSWSAIGGGTTIAEALADAGQSLPGTSVWEVAGWSDLYGD